MFRKTSALAFAFSVVGSGASLIADQRITPPAVPGEIVISADVKPFFAAHAVGTQNYICAPAPGGGLDWLFIGPQATIFDNDGEQVLTHFHSKNPFRNDLIQATWQHSRDTSAIWAIRSAGSLDAAYVAPGAIEWLLLDVSGAQVGPTGGDKLIGARFIHRVNTIGGMKPPTAECTPGAINNRRLVYYEADYYFYR
jgi:hypothetical protein